MDVALDGLPLASERTGVGHYTFELARSLARIAPHDDFTLLSNLPLEPSVAAEFKKHPQPNLHNSQISRPRRWWSLGLPLYLKANSFDVFHGTNYDIPIWGRPPSVLTIHDLSILLHSDTHEAKLVRRARRRLPLMARLAKRIITPTESVKREVCKHLGVAPEKIAVTAYAPRSVFRRIDPEQITETRQRLGIRDDFILFVGTIEPRKNLLGLVRAFDEILRKTSLRPQLVLAGKKGWLTSDLFAFIKTARLDDHICFTGYLADSDLCALYSSCSLFVYPSLYEGFGLPPLEAMSCAAPVLTSKIPPIMETVQKSACLVDPTNVTEIAGAIVQLLQERQLRRQLSLSGWEHVQKFSWERTAARTFEVYREVVMTATVWSGRRSSL